MVFKEEISGNERRSILSWLGGTDVISRATLRALQRANQLAIKENPGLSLLKFSDLDETRKKALRICQITHEIHPISKFGMSLVSGAYRDVLGLLIALAKKALSDPTFRFIEPGVMHWVFKGDGCPFGKKGLMNYCVTLVEFRTRVHQPINNLLSFCGFVKEDGEASLSYCAFLCESALALENKPFTVKHRLTGSNEWMSTTIRFRRGMICGDQKFLAAVNGELSCSATYFSPFVLANIKQYGWHWFEYGKDGQKLTYSMRKEHVRKVQEAKKTLQQKSGKSPDVASICKNLETRVAQEPFTKELSDTIEIDFFHIGLLTWHHWIEKVLIDLVLPCGGQRKRSFEILPDHHIAKAFTLSLKNIGLNELSQTVEKIWMNDSEVKKDSLVFKFRGQEVRALCQNFSHLLSLFPPYIANKKNEGLLIQRLCYFLKEAILLCKMTSLGNRVDVVYEQVAEFIACCKEYHILKSIAFGGSYLRQIDFTVGVVCPNRAQHIWDRFGLGLGIATNQGLEHKHEDVKKLLNKTSNRGKFLQVFQLDNLRSFHLPVNMDVSIVQYVHTAESYMPRVKEGMCSYCMHTECNLCSKYTNLSKILSGIESSIVKKKWVLNQ